MCNCRTRIQNGIKEKHGIDGRIAVEILSGKTYSNLTHRIQTSRGRMVEKTMPILHSHCPWCGEKYENG